MLSDLSLKHGFDVLWKLFSTNGQYIAGTSELILLKLSELLSDLYEYSYIYSLSVFADPIKA